MFTTAISEQTADLSLYTWYQGESSPKYKLFYILCLSGSICYLFRIGKQKFISCEFRKRVYLGLSGTYQGESSQKYKLNPTFYVYPGPLGTYPRCGNRKPFSLSSERASIWVDPVPVRENQPRNIITVLNFMIIRVYLIRSASVFLSDPHKSRIGPDINREQTRTLRQK